MWSQWVWVSNRWIGGGPAASSARPSSRAPVPQSSTKQVPSAVRTSTQDVFPPNRVVAGPGAGTEPLVPQKRTRKVHSPHLNSDSLLLPRSGVLVNNKATPLVTLQ